MIYYQTYVERFGKEATYSATHTDTHRHTHTLGVHVYICIYNVCRRMWHSPAHKRGQRSTQHAQAGTNTYIYIYINIYIHIEVHSSVAYIREEGVYIVI